MSKRLCGAPVNDNLRFVGAVLLTLALFASCLLGPFWLASKIGLWFGLVGAVAALAVWTALVRPVPGYVQGIVCLTGLCALAGQLLFWIIRLIEHGIG